MSPKISIVTINYNHVDGLKLTIESVLGQSYDNLEYIIIDGGSNDGSAELIEERKEQLSYAVSEKDGGIYDAMNKGIQAATGEWINFMNSGDVFYGKQVISDFAEVAQRSNAELIYGHSIARNEMGEERVKLAGIPSEVWMSGKIRHNAMFSKSSLMKEHPFTTDPKLKVIADFDFIYKMFCLNQSFQRIDQNILIFEEDGISAQRSRLEEILDVYKIHYRNRSLKPIPYLFHARKLAHYVKSRLARMGRKLLKTEKS